MNNDNEKREEIGCNVSSICVYTMAPKRKSFNRIDYTKHYAVLLPAFFCHHHNNIIHIHMNTHFFPKKFFFFVCVVVVVVLFSFCLLFWFLSRASFLQHGVIFVWCHATITKQIRFIGFDGALTLVCKCCVYAWGFCGVVDVSCRNKWVVCLGN